MAAGKSFPFTKLPSSTPSPLFLPHTRIRRPSTGTIIRFSGWGNANARPHITRNLNHQAPTEKKELPSKTIREEKFPEPSRTIQKVFEFKPGGASSSRPSIPGKRSNYSETLNGSYSRHSKHPAFRRRTKTTRIPPADEEAAECAAVSVGESGISYRVPDAPFEFQYSYTETPKVKPLALREPAFVPFGPSTMPRPWTGCKPMPPSKKKLPEFDSFNPPPANKKGVKSVQSPGPFRPGKGPMLGKTREEVLGEELTAVEVKGLVESCLKSRRLLHMGRDGFTHNMLENIHSHWKRRRVCKIKCLGVCTVDMDNVCQQLEEKSGGKVIYRRGGILYLFRGRNYNYRYRPKYPLMLWRPIAPVYPKLVKAVPDGLTIEEVQDMRKRARKLIPICKLGKNGVYTYLVNDVREAFEVCELVRVNCEGMNSSDFKRIGGKLQDLVPCTLLSFENEHILMWRGKDWRTSLSPPSDNLGLHVSDALKENWEEENVNLVKHSTESIQPASMITDWVGGVCLEEDQVPEMASLSSSDIGVLNEGLKEDNLVDVLEDSLNSLDMKVLDDEEEEFETSFSPEEDAVNNRECLNDDQSHASASFFNQQNEFPGSDPGLKTKILELNSLIRSSEENQQPFEIFGASHTSTSLEEFSPSHGLANPQSWNTVESTINEEKSVLSPSRHAHTIDEMQDTKSDSRNSSDHTCLRLQASEFKSINADISDCAASSIIQESQRNLMNAVDDIQVGQTIPTHADACSNLSGLSDCSEKLDSLPSGSEFHAEYAVKENEVTANRLKLLLQEAAESGMALCLDPESLDADLVFQKAVEHFKIAPPGPVYKFRHRNAVMNKKTETLAVAKIGSEIVHIAEKSRDQRSSKKKKDKFPDVAVKRCLQLDELAKLLS